MLINQNAATPGIVNPEVALIEEVLTRRAMQMDDDRMDAVTQLLKVATGANFYACQNDHAINTVWTELRAQPAVFTLFMDVLVEFISRMGGLDSQAMEECIQGWAYVLTHSIHPEGYADETLRERVRIKIQPDAAAMLKNNIWLVCLGVISQVSVLKVIRDVMEQRDQLSRWRNTLSHSK